MRIVTSLFVSALVLGVLAFVGARGAEEKKEDKPKYTIKEIMKKYHADDGLRDKAVAGKATPEEKKELVEAYTVLAQNKPPMGDEKAWKERTEAIIKAAKSDDGEALKKATNCGSCHKEFKKPKQ
jgi:hypothetical protein